MEDGLYPYRLNRIDLVDFWFIFYEVPAKTKRDEAEFNYINSDKDEEPAKAYEPKLSWAKLLTFRQTWHSR